MLISLLFHLTTEKKRKKGYRFLDPSYLLLAAVVYCAAKKLDLKSRALAFG